MNVELQKRHSCRTVDSIKGLRKKPVYQEFVELARVALRGVESSIIVEVPIFPDHSDSDLVRAISEMTVRPQLTSKTESLAMVAASVAAADKAATLALLGNYLRDVFPPKPTGNGRRRTSNNPLLPRNSHQRRRMEYAVTQKGWDKQRSKLIRSLLDGQTEHTMPSKERTTAYWTSMFTGNPPEVTTPVIESTSVSADMYSPITMEEVKRNKLEAASSSGPDGMTVKTWNSLPADIRVQILNLILWCRDIPEEYHIAQTSLIPKVPGADRPELFRPITVAPVLCRALNKILAERLARTRIHEAQRAFIKVVRTTSHLWIVF